MKRMKQILSLLLILAMLFTLAGGALAEENGAETDENGETAESGLVLNDGSPWVNWSLRENIAQAEKKPDSPKDDFYLWVNYDWLKSAEIKPGNYITTPMLDAENEIVEQAFEVLNDTTLTSEDATMVQHLYKAFLDWDARNALGVAPLQKEIDRIRAVSSIGELTQLLCAEDYRGATLFTYGVRRGPNDPDTWITEVVAQDLLLEDSAEYRERTDYGDLCEASLRSVFPRMMKKLGYSPEETSEMLDLAFALETELADSMITKAEEMAPDHIQRINNEMSRAEAETLCSSFPWLDIMYADGYAGAQRFLVYEPAWLQKMDEIWREERLEHLKNDLIVTTVQGYMCFLDRESYDLYWEMQNKKYGIEGSTPDEDIAYYFVCSFLPKQMACAFFEKYDPTKMKNDITRICKEAIDCYREMLREEEWLTEETRAKAIEKLDAMHILAVYPEKWPDYSGLSIEGLGLYDCLHAISRYDGQICRSLVDQPVDRDLWYYTGEDASMNNVLQGNAIYDPSLNTFIILRGILGDTIYREDMSDEELYGAIGTIIAHEISHAFDPTCSQYDATGKLNSWWTEADHDAFDARAKKLIDYYNGMTIFSGIHLFGENIQGEAVADMGGVKCMLRLLEKKKEDVDYRTFFEAFARIYRTLITVEMEHYKLLQDPHPADYIRVNSVVQQFPQFFETYGIQEGDGMWLAPEDRVAVW